VFSGGFTFGRAGERTARRALPASIAIFATASFISSGTR